MIPQRIITIVLLIGLCFGASMLVTATDQWRMPDDQQGYAPIQPIEYSHRLHAGELGIDCRFCHTSAESGRYAGIPSSDVCMKCHNFVTSSLQEKMQELELAKKENRKPKKIISDKLKPLYDSLKLDENLKPIQGKEPESIPWVRVHNLPDYVYFNHSAHVTAGVDCQHCHGPIESMDRVRQHATLSMGWCVNCHREANEKGIQGKPVEASTNCTVCHY